MKGGSIGRQQQPGDSEHGAFVSSHDSEDDAKAKAGRMNKILSPGEKKYYGIKYHVKQETNANLRDPTGENAKAAAKSLGFDHLGNPV